MNQKVKVGSSGNLITLTDRHYKASGGEAAIYVHNGTVYKLYHEPDKKFLPPQKMQELATIGNSQIVIPKDIVFDPSNGKPLGYTTTYVDDAEPLLKLFTRTFKEDNNISYRMINELVKMLQLTVADVHSAQCLIVDLNELNILFKLAPTKLTPWFIDTDSYSTPSFKATAIMDSVRDRRVSILDKKGTLHYNPDEMSDWFSWAILSFWLYTNIHPYRGNHSNYKPRDKAKQMDDGISVFHAGVRTPPSVNDFKVIPPRHLDWFKLVFLKNERSVPPLPDSSVPLLVPTSIITIKGTDKLGVEEIAAYPDAITSIAQFMGLHYVITRTHLYVDKKEVGSYKAKKALFSFANDGTPIVATLNGTKIAFTELTSNTPIGTINSEDMFARNGAIYTFTNGKLVENSFTAFGGKTIHRINEIENVSVVSAKVYDGCVIQDLLGKKYLTLPYKRGSCFSKYISALNGFRVVDAKSDKTVTVVLAEKNGIYHRFIIIFDKNYTKFDVREVKDVAYDTINFAVMDNGLCILLAGPTEVELFAQINKQEILADPPFDTTMKLFTTPDGIFFINGNSFHQLKRK